MAHYITGYTPSSGRGDFNAVINLPSGAGATKAVLSQNGADMQDNVDYSKYLSCDRARMLVCGPGCGADRIAAGQYWANVTDGKIHIPRVKADTYRLTIYAEGVFGQYERDDVVVKAGDGGGAPFTVTWEPESHGMYLFPSLVLGVCS